MFIILNIYRRLRYGIDGNGGDQSCPSLPVRCDPDSKVRTYDGTCNNLQFPEWGAISKPYQRFFRPMYEDGRTSFLVLLPFIFSIVSINIYLEALLHTLLFLRTCRHQHSTRRNL